MLPVSGIADNRAVDLAIEIYPGHLFISMSILLEFEFHKGAILEENTDSKLVIIPRLVPEDTDHLLLDQVGESLV